MQNITLKLVKPSDVNPFRQYPELKTIWLPELAKLAEEAIDETFEEVAEYPDEDIGGIFLIQQDNKVMGITGFYPTENESQFFLRWHGLLNEYRGLGYSEHIIRAIAEHIENAYPQAKELIEYMPVIDEYIPIKNYFEKLGFKKVGNPENVDWSDYEWQSYSLELNKLEHKIAVTL
jgi:N-acetylglutamate synthase-like GNAT family acetyltransferase